MSSRRFSLRVWLLLLIIASILCVAAWVHHVNKKAGDAAELLRLTENLIVGTTTRNEFLEMTKPYRRYMFRSDADVITFRIENGKTLIGISAMFTNDRASGRAVGLLQDVCCSVSMTQRPSDERDIQFGRAQALQTIVGDPNYLRFDVSPNLDQSAIREVFDFQTNCLRLMSHCDSVDKLDPSTSALLRASVAAGY